MSVKEFRMASLSEKHAHRNAEITEAVKEKTKGRGRKITNKNKRK